MFNVSANDGHVRFYVSGDAYDTPCMWADAAHSPADCDTCAADNRFVWGPAVVLAKPDTVRAVWVAACRVLLAHVPDAPSVY